MTSSLRRYWRRIAMSTNYHGVSFTLFWCMLYVFRLTNTTWCIAYREKHLDRIQGIDTAGKVELADLGVKSHRLELAIPYEASSPDFLFEVLSDLPIRTQDYVFVDLGSGKGLALLVASMFSFKRIVGVEWSPRLTEVARENVRKFRNSRRKCRNIEVINDDVSLYMLPDVPLVIYMFNPFKEELVRGVLHHVRDSLNQCPRHIVLVYYNPVWKQVLEESGFLRLTETRDDGLGVAIYETKLTAPELRTACTAQG